MVEKTGGKKRTQSKKRDKLPDEKQSPGNIKGLVIGIATPGVSSASDTSLSYNSCPLNTQSSTTTFSTEKALEQILTFSRGDHASWDNTLSIASRARDTLLK